MPEPTPEQKRKTILLARKMLENMLAEMAPDLKDYVANQREFARMAPWNQPEPRQAEPAEDPAAQQRLNELLAEVATPKEKK